MTRHKKWIFNTDDNGIEGGRCYLYVLEEESFIDTWLQEKVDDSLDGPTSIVQGEESGNADLSNDSYGCL